MKYCHICETKLGQGWCVLCEQYPHEVHEDMPEILPPQIPLTDLQISSILRHKEISGEAYESEKRKLTALRFYSYEEAYSYVGDIQKRFYNKKGG